LFKQGARVVSILVRFVFKRHKESIMNRFLAMTAVALLLGAAPGLAQTPASPNAAQQPPMQAPMRPEPPSAIPSETSPKPLDQSSEAAKPVAPDQSAEAAKPIAPKQSAQFLTEQKPDELLASKLIGRPTVNSQDETIGNVNDLVTDRSGKVIGALIGVGGFLGIGEKHVAVRFEDLKFTRDDKDNVNVALNISKETLASAPAYKTLEEQPVVEGSVKTDSEGNTRTY
jgi:type IV secretory pathway VirB10-like protein